MGSDEGSKERVRAVRGVAGFLSRRSRLVIMLLDAVLVTLATLVALLLRFEWAIPPTYLGLFLTFAPLGVAVRLLSFWTFGLYHRLWKYASITEIVAILKAASASSFVLVVAWVLAWRGGPWYPRSVIVLDWLLTVALIAGSRFAWRIVRSGLFGLPVQPSSDTAVIVGAGDAGELAVRELLRHGEIAQPVGFIDDDATKHRLRLHGIRVLGGRQLLPRLAQKVDQIIIAIPSAPTKTIRELVELCRDGRAQLMIMSGSLRPDGRFTPGTLRGIQVEDLLGRQEVQINLGEIAAYLKGQRVLVTGAGGWIGSELCRQIIRFEPALVALVGHAENDIYEIDLELRRIWRAAAVRTVIADVRDQAKMDRLFEEVRPQVVFHAAAHKHVPLMEDNPDEAVLTNVGGTLSVAEAASRWGVAKFVFISTDKAVNPSSVMGASKRIAEMCLQHLFPGATTKFVVVRFGNVMDSTGSVIPLFRQQIARGGPVTVTHPEMMRYFMTVSEAVKLVIQAGAMGEGGEIFLLDMGEPVKIIDLARTMIRLAGLQPGVDVELRIVGTRPGEKLREEILTAEEGVVTTRHEKIFMCRPTPALASEVLRTAVSQLLEVAVQGDLGEIRPLLAAIATTYQPTAGVL